MLICTRLIHGCQQILGKTAKERGWIARHYDLGMWHSWSGECKLLFLNAPLRHSGHAMQKSAARPACTPTHPCVQTPWAGATYKIILKFGPTYPTTPPKCTFSPPLFHPNVFPSGAVCLSILNEEKDWRPTITVTQVLTGIQQLLSNPNPDDPANREAVMSYRTNRAGYEEHVRALARAYV